MLNSFNLSLLVISFLALITLFKLRSGNVFPSYKIIPLLIFLYIIIGNINLTFFQSIVGWYTDINPKQGNDIALIGFMGMFLGIIILKKIYPYLYKSTISRSRSMRILSLDYFIYLISFLAIIMNIVNYWMIGGIIIFKSNLTGYERFELMSKIPFEKAIIMSSFLICPILLRVFICKNKRNVFLCLLIINMILAVGMGHRQQIIMPVLTAGIFLAIGGFIQKKQIYYCVVILIFISVGLAFLRGDSSNVTYQSIDSMFGVEYRDYLRIRQEKIELQYGKTLFPIILNAIPKPIYDLFLLNKEDYRVYSAYIAQDMWGNDSGQRIGIWGEFFINFSDIGLVFLFVGFGVFISYIDTKLTANKTNYPSLLLLSYIYSLAMFSIIGAWATIGDDLGTEGIFFLILSKVSQSRITRVTSLKSFQTA